MAVFPMLPGLAWSVEKRPAFSTSRYTTRSRKETRLANWSYPEWEFKLWWSWLADKKSVAANVMPSSPDDALKQLLGFFLQRRGSYEPFWFTDPTDSFIGAAAKQTIIASAEAGRTDYVVPRAYGGFVEPVGAINAMNLFVNGNFQVTPSYLVNVPYDGWIRFGAAPTTGHPITWDGSYYFKVVFARDETAFENFMSDLWQNRGITLRTVWP